MHRLKSPSPWSSSLQRDCSHSARGDVSSFRRRGQAAGYASMMDSVRGCVRIRVDAGPPERLGRDGRRAVVAVAYRQRCNASTAAAVHLPHNDFQMNQIDSVLVFCLTRRHAAAVWGGGVGCSLVIAAPPRPKSKPLGDAPRRRDAATPFQPAATVTTIKWRQTMPLPRRRAAALPPPRTCRPLAAAPSTTRGTNQSCGSASPPRVAHANRAVLATAIICFGCGNRNIQ